MPLRDHFRPPLADLRHWEGLLAGWPVMIVAQLRRKLPQGYYAEPRVHLAASAEIDVTTSEDETEWAPPWPTLVVGTDLPAQAVYEVRAYDEKRRRRLAAVEIVSPANKERPEHRRAFVARCAGLLSERVSVVIIDVVTTCTQNCYAELLGLIGQSDPALGPEPPPLYATACRMTKRGDDWVLEAWPQSLAVGRSLPTLPLWLADNLAVPLELEESYEQSCAILNIP